jgi:MHS family proline/betaine transporter-like MFS transporter
LFVSLIVIITTQSSLSKEAFDDWGWRLPFLLSILLVIVSIIIRMRMKESPLFAKLKTEGKTSVNPLKESFGHKVNLKMVLLALFGATMGQGVVWYTGQFYAQTFLLRTCSIDSTQANTWIGIALLLATPFFVIFGALSDRIGRKVVMLTGMLLAIALYIPIFKGMYNIADVKAKTEITEKTSVKNTVIADAKNPADSIITTVTTKSFTDGSTLTETKKVTILADKSAEAPKPDVRKTLVLGDTHKWSIIGCIFVLVLFVTMVYGPIAAFLVELFPTRIRYTSMSLPYHIGNGVFGGLVPFIGTLFVEYTKTPTDKVGNPLAGLSYPIAIAGICFIIGLFYLSNKIDRDISDDENVYVHN